MTAANSGSLIDSKPLGEQVVTLPANTLSQQIAHVVSEFWRLKEQNSALRLENSQQKGAIQDKDIAYSALRQKLIETENRLSALLITPDVAKQLSGAYAACTAASTPKPPAPAAASQIKTCSPQTTVSPVR